MLRILFIDQNTDLFSRFQASVQTFSCLYSGSLTSAASLVNAVPPDIVCITAYPGFVNSSLLQTFYQKIGGIHRFPFLFIKQETQFLSEALLPSRYRVLTSLGEGSLQQLIDAAVSLVTISGMDNNHDALESSNQNSQPTTTETDYYPTIPETTPGRQIHISDYLAGPSPAMDQVRETIYRYAPYTDSVLVYGESGTGKELAAKLLHQLSGRKGNFVTVNSAALPHSLAEAELYGFEKGAFTDAKSGHRGVFEQAHQGTLFLDEIGDMSVALQPKLLRIIEEKHIRRLGSMRSRNINVRIVSATNAALNLMQGGTGLRQDLFFRINTLPLAIPPLRERRDDILYLADWFLSRQSGYYSLSQKTRKIFFEYDWPGNVRQLFSALRRGVICSGPPGKSGRTEIAITERMLAPGQALEKTVTREAGRIEKMEAEYGF